MEAASEDQATTQSIKDGLAKGVVGREINAGHVVPWLPCTLALEVSVVGFTVGSLLTLQKGSLILTSCHQSTDIPLQVNGLLMAWTEFEVIGERLAARITDLV